MTPESRWTRMLNHPLTLLVPIIAAGAVFFRPAAAAQSKLNVVPLPAKYTTGDTVTCLAHDFRVEYDDAAPQDLRDAVGRMMDRIAASKHRYLSPEAGDEFFAGKGCENEITVLRLEIRDPAPIAVHATSKVDDRAAREAYKLSVPVRGAASASSETALGAFRALTTFENLLYKTGQATTTAAEEKQSPLGVDTERTYAPFAPYAIDDIPAFPWRAVLLDTSRHFFSKQAILKMLDTMAGVKLSVFHWHMTDSNSWPLDLSAFPELATRGAYRGRKFTEDDVKEVVDYAAARGIDVVLEIDTPGHTAIIGESHPDFIACNQHTPWTGYANQPPAGQLRFADEGVTRFTAELFTAAAGLVRGNYFSSGGDEINMRCMAEDAHTQAALRDRGISLEAALKEFTQRTHAALLDAGKTPVVWQEMVLEHGEMGLHKDTVVDIWAKSSDVRPVLDRGFRIVHAAADYFYLDCGQGGWIIETRGSNSWCDPFKSWAQIYSFDPFNNVAEHQRKLVLGGQASLWAEQTDETNFESVMWPRAAALAELFWTGDSDAPYPRNPITALPRMHDIRYRMVDRRVRAVPLQPEWCALRPGVCVING